jgi:hypothetical protein
MNFNYSPTGASSVPSWQQSFSAPSVVPGNYSSAFGSSGSSFNTPSWDSSFTIPGVSYTPAVNYGGQPASSSWLDYAKAGGLALSAAGDAVRAYRGEPIPPGSSPFQNYLAEEKQKEGDERLAKLLKEIGGSSSTDVIEGVLDPAANKRKDSRSFGQLPSLSALFSSGGTRMAGDLFSNFR